MLNLRISDGEIHSDYELEVFVVAIDSALNENKLYITSQTNFHDVNREEYSIAQMTFLTTLNGVEVIEHIDNNVEMRGRGNSTWGFPKKPYRIRFENDTSIYGMPSARNYVLLAEYSDKSLLRNTITHKISSLFENIEHVVSTRVVEVFYNNDYLGVYTLTEHMESHENKLYVDVDYSKLDAGFFIEQDQRLFGRDVPEGLHWFSQNQRAYDIIRPNTENEKYTQAHTNYIYGYFQDLQLALMQGLLYENYIDIDNFIDYFLIQEFIKNVDVGWSSIYMYKRQDDVLKMGPLWDFDLAIGNADYMYDDHGPEGFWGTQSIKNYFFHLMMKIPEVREKFRDRYNDFHHDMLPEIMRMIDAMAMAMEPAARRNFEKWDILEIYVWPNPTEVLEATTYQGQIDYIKTFFIQRDLWMFYTVNSSEFLSGLYNQ